MSRRPLGLHIFIALIAVAWSLVSGCSIAGPKRPKPLTVEAETLYEYGSRENATSKRPFYLDAYRDPNRSPDEQRRVRNEILSEMRFQVYGITHQYRTQLRDDRNVKDLIAKLSSFSLSSAAAVVDGSATQTLSAISAGIIGGNEVVDNVLFEDQAMHAVFAAMDAEMHVYDGFLSAGMKKTLEDYPLSDGLHHLQKMIDANTLTFALNRLANKAQQEANANEAINQAIRQGAIDVTGGGVTPTIEDQSLNAADSRLRTLISPSK